ncbi:MAG: hypothetical protein K0B02_04750 [DPANN group archaeon]|nr:hypothetical protein [DPANN group archaeon]
MNKIHGYKILDSRGNWTLAVEVNNYIGITPSGASTGTYEAKTIDTEKSVNLVNTKLQKLVGMPLNQKIIDNELETIDGTDNFSNLGGNTTTAISMAVYNAIASKTQVGNIFPYPLGNVFGGGAHGGYTEFQEFLAIPTKSKTIINAIETNEILYHTLKTKLLKIQKGNIGINDEGALTAKLNNIQALDIITDIADDVGCRIGLDIAASEFFDGKTYNYKTSGKKLKPEEQIEFVIELIKKYNLYYVEDPLNELDFEGFKEITKKVGKQCLISGDDLFVTNTKRLEMGLKSANAIIIKPNQRGSITRTIETINLAKKNNYTPVISHRSAETTDTTIARLALDYSIPIIKAGVVDMRIVKLNSLIQYWNNSEKPKMTKPNLKL